MAKTTADNSNTGKDSNTEATSIPNSPPKLKNTMKNDEIRQQIGGGTAAVTPPKLSAGIPLAVFGGKTEDDHDPPTTDWFEYSPDDQQWHILRIPTKSSRIILRDTTKDSLMREYEPKDKKHLQNVVRNHGLFKSLEAEDATEHIQRMIKNWDLVSHTYEGRTREQPLGDQPLSKSHDYW